MLSFPATHSTFTTHSCRDAHGNGYLGKIFAQRHDSVARSSIVVAIYHASTRAKALRMARRALAEHLARADRVT